jgi:excisionase family DNA binding protein
MAKRPKRRDTGAAYDPNELFRKTKLNKHEAAFLLGVTPRTVDRYMNDGKLQYTKTPGGRRRPLTDSVKRYL